MLALVFAVAVAGEIEFSAGYLSAGDPKAPALSARGGVDLDDMLSLSGRLVGVPGPEGLSVGGGSSVDPAGFLAWSALLEARLHTKGFVQLHVGGGIGVGRIVSWQCSCQETRLSRVTPRWRSRAPRVSASCRRGGTGSPWEPS